MNLTRRSFLHASLMAGGLVAAPRFGRWFRQAPRIVRPYFLVTANGREYARIPAGSGLVFVELNGTAEIGGRWVGATGVTPTYAGRVEIEPGLDAVIVPIYVGAPHFTQLSGRQGRT